MGLRWHCPNIYQNESFETEKCQLFFPRRSSFEANDIINKCTEFHRGTLMDFLIISDNICIECFVKSKATSKTQCR